MNLFENFSESELLLVDITFLGLHQEAWSHSRGARVERLYRDGQTGPIKIRDFYAYEFTDDNRTITGMTRTIHWYDKDGNVGLSKVIDKNLSRKKLKALNREIRQGRIDSLEQEAEKLRDNADMMPVDPPQEIIDNLPGLPAWVTDLTTYNTFKNGLYTVADNIDFLFEHYLECIEHYIDRGTMEFENAIANEDDPAVLAILDIEAVPPGVDPDFPNGLTVRQSIVYQLNGSLD